LIAGVSLSTIAHSTEDVSKVKRALSSLLPEAERVSVSIEASVAKGHYGNEITVLSLEARRDAAKDVVDHILRLLPVGDRIRIRDRIDLYYDGHSALFLRLDKQSTFLGTPRISERDDVIRVKVSVLSREAKERLPAILKLLDLA